MGSMETLRGASASVPAELHSMVAWADGCTVNCESWRFINTVDVCVYVCVCVCVCV
jgi:hypothetical protein